MSFMIEFDGSRCLSMVISAGRCNDVLIASIGTPEISRRVRGYGGTGIKVVYEKGPKWKTSHGTCISKSELHDVLGLQRAEMTAQFNNLFLKILNSYRITLYIPFY
jgi:hypothetical protein